MMPSASIPKVSVIVATLDRSHYLRLCLDALTRQTAGFEHFEVIVVDNGSSDETPDLARSYCGERIKFVYVREDRRGLSIARNTGVRESAAEIVAFTDDDAVPDSCWVEKIATRFEALDAHVAVLGGEVRPIWEAPRPKWLTDQLLRPLSAGLFWGPTARLLRGDEWLVEVNIAYRKSTLIEFGGFAEYLGRVGDSLLSCDGCVNLLLARGGFQAYYDPEIVVGHHIHSSRLTPNWFRRRFFWQGVSMNRVHSYLEEMSKALNLPPATDDAQQEEIMLPTSASAWADLFNDHGDIGLEQQFYLIEQLGYLLQSQALIAGR